MTDLVHVVHNAPVWHRPPRSRVPRMSYARMVTPAPLREFGSTEAVAGPLIPTPGGRVVRTMMLDGTAWRRVRLDDGGSDGVKNVDAAGLRAFLSGDPEVRHMDDRDAGRNFAGTPLMARLPRHQGLLRVYDEWDDAAAGQVLADARERARRALVDHMADSVALIGGVAHVRLRGPIAFWDPKVAKARINRLPGALTLHAVARDAMPFRIDRLDELARHTHGEGTTADDIRTEWDPRLLDGLRPDREDDTRLFVADALRVLVEGLERVPADGIPHPADRLALIREHAGLASLGLFRDDEIEPLCELVVSAARDLRENAGDVYITGRMAAYAAFAEDFVLPRIRSAIRIDPDDVAALGGLTR